MKLKFNIYERVAGLFVLSAMALGVVGTLGIGIQKGWFEKKVPLKTYVPNADGVRPGTAVQLAGIEIGSVTEIDLQPGRKVEIRFKILSRFSSQIRNDSRVRVLRPFVIGEKVLELTPGEETSPKIVANMTLAAEAAPDFLDFLGGNKLGAYMETIDGTMKNLQKLAEAFLSDERSTNMIALFDKMLPLLDQMSVMAREVGHLSKDLNHDNKFENTIVEALALTKVMNRDLPGITKSVPGLSRNVNKLTKNLNVLIGDFQRMVPLIEKIGPDLPGASKTIVQALNETVITLKAMQKTIFLRSSVREVLEEEADKVRKPANK